MKLRLGEIAYARSGDKGAAANVGVIARKPQHFELLWRHLTADVVGKFFNVRDAVRYELPNLGALNFLLPEILDGGGSVSLKTDAQGKALGQRLLELELEIPDAEMPR